MCLSEILDLRRRRFRVFCVFSFEEWRPCPIDLWTVKHVLKTVILHALALATVLVTVELGLRTAAWFKSVSRNQKVAEDRDRFDALLIGDSILGTIEDPNTAAGRFLSYAKASRPSVEVGEVTLGGLTSGEALERMRELLSKRSVGTAILMVGKNDWVRGWVDKTFDRLVHSPPGNFEITEAFMVLAAEAQKRYLSLRPDREARAQKKDFTLAWSLYREQTPEAIPEFEKQLLKHPNYVRAIRALVHLYYLHWRLDEGIQFLEKLKSVSLERALVDVHIGYLQSDRSKAKGERAAPDDSGWESSVRSMEDQRLAFIARLRIAHIADDTAAFAQEFETMGPEQSEVLPPSTLANLEKLVGLLLNAGVRVVVVEYPSHHSRPLRNALSKFGGDIEIYDSREWLLRDLPPEGLLSAFQPDCDHLEKSGAEVVGKELSRIFLK